MPAGIVRRPEEVAVRMVVKVARAPTQRRPWGVVLVVAVVAMAVAVASPTPVAGATVHGPGATVENGPPVGTISVVDHRGLAAPGQIVTAANGDMWFLNGSSVGRITTAGQVTIFSDPSIVNPFAIAAGSDGNAWFTNAGSAWGSTVGRITPAGVVTMFAIPGQGQAIVAGADGALWTYMKLGDRFTQVYRITTDGVGSYTPLAGPFEGWDFDQTSRLAAGADGSIWYDGPWGSSAEPQGLCECVGRYFDGVLHELAPGHRPGMIRTVVTPDGDLWFTSVGDGIGRMHPDGAFTIFHDAAIHDPKEIAVGPDGALWFTNGDAAIGRITLDGVVTSFSGPGIDHPRGVAAGADGAVWFTNLDNSVGRITLAGVVTTFTHPGIVVPGDPVLGADGALWFPNGPSSIGRTTDDGVLKVFTDPRIGSPSALRLGSDGNLYFNAASGLGQIAPDGTFSYYAAPPYPPAATPPSFPAPMPPIYESVGGSTLGPDGNVWMTVSAHVDYRPYKPLYNMAAVVRLSPAGVRTYFPLPDLDTPGAIVAGPDGNLWFADGTIVRITTDGVMTFFPSAGAASDIVVGPDGALWYVSRATDAVGRITTSGAVTSFADPSIHGPHGIASGPNGSLWFANGGTATLGRIQAATPVPGSAFHPLVPQRILDSRGPTGGWGSKLVAGSPRELQVAGMAGVAATATAVVVNVTATGSDVGSFLSVSPGGGGATNVSNLNFAAGETIANLVTAKLGPTGSVVLATALGSVDVIADVVGYYEDSAGGDLYNGLTPTRLLDSRSPVGGWNGPLTAGVWRRLTVRQPGNAAGVPPSATAVIANVTATQGTAGSFLSVWPSGASQPTASNLNFGRGQTIANLVVVGIGAEDSITFANAVGDVDVIVDIVGYFDPSSGSLFHPVTPTRVLDDRVGLGLAGAWGAGQTSPLPVAGASGTGVPAGATGVVMNLTATNATAGSFVTAFPDGVVRPGSSTLNFGPGQTIPNLVTVALGANGRVDLYNATGTVDLVGDITGYYAKT